MLFCCEIDMVSDSKFVQPNSTSTKKGQKLVNWNSEYNI